MAFEAESLVAVIGDNLVDEAVQMLLRAGYPAVHYSLEDLEADTPAAVVICMPADSEAHLVAGRCAGLLVPLLVWAPRGFVSDRLLQLMHGRLLRLAHNRQPCRTADELLAALDQVLTPTAAGVGGGA